MQRGYDPELCMEDGCDSLPSPDPDETQGGVDTEAQMRLMKRRIRAGDTEAHTCLLTVRLHTIKNKHVVVS